MRSYRDIRLDLLTRFARGMGDIHVSRSPLRRDVLVGLHTIKMDVYQDVESEEWARFYKQAVIRKNVDMDYVQTHFGEFLVEDSDSKIPWGVEMTMTGLPRVPQIKDRIFHEGLIYSVSSVRPFNRDVDSIVYCMVYPERTEYSEPLGVLSVRFRLGSTPVLVTDLPSEATSLLVDVIWTGCPREMSFDLGQSWVPFRPVSRFVFYPGMDKLLLRDGAGHVIGYNYVTEEEVV